METPAVDLVLHKMSVKSKRNLLEDHEVRWQLSRVPRMQMALSQCWWDEWVNGQEHLAFIEEMNTTVLLTQLWNSINGWPEGTFYRYNLLLIQLTGQLLIRRQGINEAKDLHWMPLGASYLCSKAASTTHNLCQLSHTRACSLSHRGPGRRQWAD